MTKNAGDLLMGAVVTMAAFIAPGVSYGQASSMGEWSAVQDWPLEAIHATLLPTGKILVWQTWTESVGLWDPVTNQFSATPFPQHNPFCAGHAFLADGRLLVAGGHTIGNNFGEHRANIYDPFTNTWANNVPNMPPAYTNPISDGRWYPSATTLGNGDVLVMSGDMDGSGDVNDLPQVYEAATNTWRNLTGARKVMDLYPRSFLMSDGAVLGMATYEGTARLDTSGTGNWTVLGPNPLDPNPWAQVPAVMYDVGKIAFFGSGVPTANIQILDLTLEEFAWGYNSETLAVPRRQHNATILPDGTVLITGGTSSPDFDNNPAGKVTVPELWDPATGQVTQVAEASNIFRGYHSTALLLPDGTVLSAGGEHDDPDFQQNLNAEIYRPAYLFKGPRPTVTAAPASAPLGRTFFVATPDGADIEMVNAIVPGSVTHAQNWTQRINRLEFTEVPGGLAVTLPSNMNEMHLGYYMLFLINSNGVPSMAHWLQATAPLPGLPGDFNNDGNVDAGDYVLWRKGNGGLYSYGDYLDWQRNFGSSASGGGSKGVPEPGAAWLCAMTLLSDLGRRRRFGKNRAR